MQQYYKWAPGNTRPEKSPRNCEYQTLKGDWIKSVTNPTTWTNRRRRWPVEETSKCTTPLDPKKQAGDLKHPLHLLPTVALVQTAHVLKLGADKYGVYNWRESAGVKASTYTAAIFRHLVQYMDGEDVDEESGKSPLAHIMATCSILLDADSVGNVIDDRTKKPTPPLAP